MCIYLMKQHSDFWHITIYIIFCCISNSHYTSYHSFITEYMICCRAHDEQHAQEVSRFQEELAEAHFQLQILQKQLDDELSKQPLTNQEVRTSY